MILASFNHIEIPLILNLLPVDYWSVEDNIDFVPNRDNDFNDAIFQIHAEPSSILNVSILYNYRQSTPGSFCLGQVLLFRKSKKQFER